MTFRHLKPHKVQAVSLNTQTKVPISFTNNVSTSKTFFLYKKSHTYVAFLRKNNHHTGTILNCGKCNISTFFYNRSAI